MQGSNKQVKVVYPTFGLPKEETLGKIQAGFLEKSNTDITDEITLMLRTQRHLMVAQKFFNLKLMLQKIICKIIGIFHSIDSNMTVFLSFI